MAKTPFHPLIYQYLKKFQEDPRSRVFAPLAEAYRKAGLVEQAIQVAREGLDIHPNFMGGRVALARALFDQKEYQQVIDELAPVVREVPDNCVAQRLLAESYLILGQLAQSLDAYKMLLYFNPSDSETARLVAELEAQAYAQGVLVLRRDPVPQYADQFRVKSASQVFGEAPEAVKLQKIKRIESLQELLLRVQRYRVRVELRAGASLGRVAL
jgi:tetratricopeptide (TPR) repeat protein